MKKYADFLKKYKLSKKAPKGVDPAKHESCVTQVKEQGKDVGSAHAICTAALKKAEDEVTKSFPNWEVYFEAFEEVFPEWEGMSDDEFHDAVVEVKDELSKAEKPFHGYNKKKHAREGGLNAKYREKYNRETGSNLKAPVTEKNPKGKKLKRKKSFCARMRGVPGPTSKDSKLTPKGAALKRWRCSKSLNEFFKSYNRIKGGKADKKSPKDFDKKALAQGIKVEMEHTNDVKIAMEIAMDHLTEDKNYYKKLKQVEKSEGASFNFKNSQVLVSSDLQMASEQNLDYGLLGYLEESVKDNETVKIPLTKGMLTLTNKEPGLYSGFFQNSDGQVVEEFNNMTLAILAKNIQIKGFYEKAEAEPVVAEPEVEERPRFIKIKVGDVEIEIMKSKEGIKLNRL